MSILTYGWIAMTMFAFRPTARKWDTFCYVWQGMTFRIVGQALLSIVAVFVTMIALLMNVPVLRWSWLSLIPTSGASDGMNINLAPLLSWWLAPVFSVFFLVAVPSLAEWEEETFREGLTNWRDGAIWSVIFGMLHCLAGVPLGAGLALSVAGALLTRAYFTGGIDRATRLHTAVNSIFGVGFLIGSCIGAYHHLR